MNKVTNIRKYNFGIVEIVEISSYKKKLKERFYFYQSQFNLHFS